MATHRALRRLSYRPPRSKDFRRARPGDELSDLKTQDVDTLTSLGAIEPVDSDPPPVDPPADEPADLEE